MVGGRSGDAHKTLVDQTTNKVNWSVKKFPRFELWPLVRVQYKGLKLETSVFEHLCLQWLIYPTDLMVDNSLRSEVTYVFGLITWFASPGKSSRVFVYMRYIFKVYLNGHLRYPHHCDVHKILSH